MPDVLWANEDAYRKKYGESLNEKWDRIPEHNQLEYLKTANAYKSIDLPEEYYFDDNEILRILIGFINVHQLEVTFGNTTQVTRVLLWEPEEEVFIAGCVYEDISEYINDERLVIALGRGDKILNRAFSMSVFENNILHRHIYAYGKYLKPNNEDIELFIKSFEKYYVEMVSRMNFTKQYEHLVYKNFLYSVNVLNNNSTLPQLFDRIPVRDIPVIIVAAGPSLMKNCLELKKAKGRAIIIAVAHSMKTLVMNGIRPDLVATTDPASPFFLDFDNKRDYTLLCCVYSNKVFQGVYNGRLIFYGFPIYKRLFSSRRTDLELNADFDTGSVATDVLSLFEAAGFKRFILVGQDLAFGEDGTSHTNGQKEIREEDIGAVFPETESIDGKMLKTRNDWVLFRQYYEKRIRADNTLDIIDATEGGALIHGSKVMKLNKAIEDYCVREYPIDEWIKGIPKGDKEEKTFIDEWFGQLTWMNERSASNLMKILALCNEILDSWNDRESWNDDFAAKCKRYDIMYNVILEGDDAIHLREYCRADIERYIEEAFTLEGDEKIESRMKRERELFELIAERLKEMQAFIDGLER